MLASKMLKWIHCVLGFLWLYQGIFPKLLFTSSDEIAIWESLGFNTQIAHLGAQIGGVAEIVLGVLFLFWQHKLLHYLNIAAMVSLLLLVAITLPHALVAAFNPVVMNYEYHLAFPKLLLSQNLQ
ncbi:DoxX-like family protein [Vitreoscilla stercoraria]|uniref:DoxX-like family protein n=1 Tax=Vitreoscilla stercoraria TaxID=61 RepID=UPI0009DA1794